MSYVVNGRGIVDGIAIGKVMISSQPISFYGGVDPETGVIREKNHPLEGLSLKNKILFFPYGKKSYHCFTSASAIFNASSIASTTKSISSLVAINGGTTQIIHLSDGI